MRALLCALVLTVLACQRLSADPLEGGMCPLVPLTPSPEPFKANPRWCFQAGDACAFQPVEV